MKSTLCLAICSILVAANCFWPGPTACASEEVVTDADKVAVTIGSPGPGAEQSYQNILWALGKMPRKFKDCLWGGGYHIISVSTIDEWQSSHHARPFHSKDHPEWTYKNLSGLTGNRIKQILIGQYQFKRPVDRRVTFHECGHAFDNVRQISRSDAFATAYKLDSCLVKNPKFAWTARGEICAQLVAVEMCKNNVGGSDRPGLSSKFAEAWPNCAAIVREQLAYYR